MLANCAIGLYIVTVFLFSHYQGYTFIPKLAALVLFIAHVAHATRQRERIIHISAVHVVFLLWLGLAVVRGLFSGSFNASLERGLTTIEVFLVSLILYSAVLNTKSYKSLAWAFVLGTLTSSAGAETGLLPNLPDLSEIETRFSATFGNANLFGYACVVSVSFIVFLWRTNKSNLLRSAFGIITIYFLVSIINTGSRKAIFGIILTVVLGYLAFIFSTKSWGMKKRAAAIMTGAVLATCFVGIFSSFVLKSNYAFRIQNLDRFVRGKPLVKYEESLAHRKFLYKTGLRMFFENPAFGKGLASFAESRTEQRGWRAVGVYSHSNVIEVLVSSGIFGFTLYYTMFGIILFKLLIYAKRWPEVRNDPIFLFLFTVLPFTLFFDLFAVTYYVKEAWIVLTALIAGTTLLGRSIPAEGNSSPLANLGFAGSPPADRRVWQANFSSPSPRR